MSEQNQNVVATELNLPADGSTMTNVVTPPNPEAAAAAPKKDIFFAGRRFDSEADALAYASTLAPQPAASPAPQTQEEVDPADILFEDPKAALRLAREQVKNEIRREYTAVEQQKKIWNDFYAKNKDLQGMEDFVNAAQQTKWEQIKNLPIEQALEQVAKDTRSMIQRARGNTGVSEKMNSNGAMTASSSPVPGVSTVVQPTKQMSMVDEIKAMRARGKKVV